MSRGFTNTVVMGNVTKDPELRNTTSGTNVATFTLAVNDKDDQVSYIDCVAFNKTADTIAKFVKRGDAFLVQGSLKQRSWEQEGLKRSKIEVIVQGFAFISNKSDRPLTQHEVLSAVVELKEENEIDLSEIPF